MNPATNRVYVPNQTSDSFTIIDGASNTTSLIFTGAGPGPLAVNPGTNRIYVASHPANTIAVVDGAAADRPLSGVVVEFYHAGLDHYFITADPEPPAAAARALEAQGHRRTLPRLGEAAMDMPRWPYEVRYGTERSIDCDVLLIVLGFFFNLLAILLIYFIVFVDCNQMSSARTV